MDNQVKQHIDNIASLVKQRKLLFDEINSLANYKKKIELARQEYARRNGAPKT